MRARDESGQGAGQSPERAASSKTVGMPLERHKLPPRERTFAELFPWRNIRRALMLVLLIVAIVVIKRSTSSLLARVGEMWGPSSSPPPSSAGPYPPRGAGVDRQIRLGPGLTPRPSPTDLR